mgnify:CR=1 FL=1
MNTWGWGGKWGCYLYVYVSMYILDEFDQHKVCIYAVEIDQPLNSYRFCDGCG